MADSGIPTNFVVLYRTYAYPHASVYLRNGSATIDGSAAPTEKGEIIVVHN